MEVESRPADTEGVLRRQWIEAFATQHPVDFRQQGLQILLQPTRPGGEFIAIRGAT